MKKYFSFDVDGTLVWEYNGTKLDIKTEQAIKQLVSNGHFVALATGRGHYLAKIVAQQLGFKNFVCEGGNGVVINNELIKYEPLDRNSCIEIIEELEKFKFPHAFGVDDSNVGINRIDSTIEFNKEYERFLKIKYDKDYDLKDAKEFRRLYLLISPQQEQQMKSLKKYKGMRYDNDLMIVEPFNKHEGIELMMNIMNAPLEDVVVFGDGINDINMFENAAFSIAMGNSCQQLKDIADYITTDCDKEGVINALKKFEWI